ncbi:MAG: ribonuclease P protein component [Candidatus Paceibacterota bacterium]|jgi:ribonuclease P protein component
MLAKKFKLPIQEGLKKNQKAFSFLKGKYFNFKISKNDLNYSRFGVIVSSKIFKKAFARNKLRRIIFEKIRSKNYYLNPGNDILIITLPEASKNFLIGAVGIEKIIKDLESSFNFIHNQ